MLRILVHNWWLLVSRSILAFAFSLLVYWMEAFKQVWLLQEVAMTSVVELFGLFAISAGLLTLACGLRSAKGESGRWLLVLDGIGAFLAGLAAILAPGITFTVLVQLIGTWAVFAGLSEVLIARKLRHHVPDEVFLVLAGAGSVGWAIYLFATRISKVPELAHWLGSYALFSSVAMLGLALRLRKFRRQAHAEAAHAAGTGRA